MDPQSWMGLELAGLIVLGVLYFVIAVFRSSYAELNTVVAGRILSSRGLGPREGQAPSDLPPVVRATFDLAHHFVLIAASALCLHRFVVSGVGRPYLTAALVLVAGMAVIQVGARALALSDPERAFSISLMAIALLFQVLRPIVAPVAWSLSRIRRTGRSRRAASAEEEDKEEEIEALIDAGEQEGLLEAEEGELIRQVIEFHDRIVREVMTPRTEVVALPRGTTIEQARAVFARERHSRIPVYREQIDNVEGIITLKDLVASWERLPPGATIDSLMLTAYFVPETKLVSELLKEMQARRVHLAVVVDEYGGTAGVVTLEDLLEELVGEIQEEHEREEIPVVQESDGAYLALGTASLGDLGSAVGAELDAEEGIDTVSGLIYSVLGRIPSEGESVEVHGLRLEVVKADTRRIDRVRVTRLAATEVP
ncbi:MAG TPA: hemolysin family protein [Candidatus Polarisedimenticolia bacterium]|nr:hemolysin family protein [Candidatus Polarisedimenticolia bacterium]